MVIRIHEFSHSCYDLIITGLITGYIVCTGINSSTGMNIKYHIVAVRRAHLAIIRIACHFDINKKISCVLAVTLRDDINYEAREQH